MRTEWFECACWGENHAIRFSWFEFDHDGEQELTVAVQMNHEWSWWKRVVHAVRYVFKNDKSGGYYPYDCTILRPADMLRLKDLCDRVLRSGRKPE